MKARRCNSPIEPFVGILEGKVSKLHLHSRDITSSKGNEAAQVVAYLDRLQDLVPHCPKNRPISKLQLIQAVIDYIYDLEEVLLNDTKEEEEEEEEEEEDKEETEEDEEEVVELEEVSVRKSHSHSNILACQRLVASPHSTDLQDNDVIREGVLNPLWHYDDVITESSFNKNDGALLVMPS